MYNEKTNSSNEYVLRHINFKLVGPVSFGNFNTFVLQWYSASVIR